MKKLLNPDFVRLTSVREITFVTSHQRSDEGLLPPLSLSWVESKFQWKCQIHSLSGSTGHCFYARSIDRLQGQSLVFFRDDLTTLLQPELFCHDIHASDILCGEFTSSKKWCGSEKDLHRDLSSSRNPNAQQFMRMHYDVSFESKNMSLQQHETLSSGKFLQTSLTASKQSQLFSTRKFVCNCLTLTL